METRIEQAYEIESFHFNTKFRKNYYKTPSTRCEFSFAESNKYKSIRLAHIAIPNSWYLFSNLLENNKFIVQFENETNDSVEILEVIIPEGNYTPGDLENFLNATYFHESGRNYGFSKIKFSISKHTLKSTFSLVNSTIEDKNKFNLLFIDATTNTIMNTCGWLLGFRYGKYFNIKDEVYSEGLYDGGGDRYVYFCLRNSELQNSYNRHKILLEDQRLSFQSDNVLAKLYLKNGKFTINIDDQKDNEFSYSRVLILKESQVIEKIQISLIDQYGQEIYLNNMDFSFTLEMYKDV